MELPGTRVVGVPFQITIRGYSPHAVGWTQMEKIQVMCVMLFERISIYKFCPFKVFPLFVICLLSLLFKES